MMILIKNVKLFSKDVKKQDILICSGKIVEIDDEINCSLNCIEKVIDAKGLVALPGYIDQHVHITGGGGEGGFSAQVPPLKLSQLIRAGVTTVVGLLGTDGTTRSVENLVAKTKALNEEGWTAYCLTGSYEYPSPTITNSVRKDIVFISEVIGVKIAISDHRASGMSKKELTDLAFNARTGGILSAKPGVVHLHVGSGKAGISDIIDIVNTTELPVSTFKPTHLGRHVEQALEFAKLGGYIDFTAGTDPAHTADVIAYVLSKVCNKGLVTLSSDGNGSMPKWNEKKEIVGISAGSVSADHEVIKALVNNHGLSLRDAVAVITENPAKSLGLYPYKGSVAVGSCADIVFVDDNLDIDTVIANGRIYMMNKNLLYTPKFE